MSPTRLAPRLLVNAIFIPSGDQAGQKSPAGLSVIRGGTEPSASITKISSLPSPWLVETILLPSGDPAGTVVGDGLTITWPPVRTQARPGCYPLHKRNPHPRAPIAGRFSQVASSHTSQYDCSSDDQAVARATTSCAITSSDALCSSERMRAFRNASTWLMNAATLFIAASFSPTESLSSAPSILTASALPRPSFSTPLV